MNDTLFHWLTWPASLDGQLSGATLQWFPVFGAWGTVLLLAGLAVLTIYIQARTARDLSRGQRGVLLGLRLAALALLLPALLDVSLQARLQREEIPVLALAVDTSASMALADQALFGDDATRMPRLEAVKQTLLQGPDAPLDRLVRQTRTQLFAFDAAARPLDGADPHAALLALEATGQQTNLTGALEEIARHLRGQPNAGMLLFTDGAANVGGSPLALCERRRQEGIALHTVTVGDEAPKDVEVRQVLVDQLLFRGDPAVAIVRLRQRGYDGLRIPVALRHGDTELAREEAVFAPGQTELNLPLRFVPLESGEQRFVVEAVPLPDEASVENNRRAFVARITAERIRVLYIEQQPRWQYRFLRDAMNRDRRLEPRIMLFGGEQTDAPQPPFINALPGDREAYREIDLIILGDVDPSLMTRDQLEWMAEQVREEGTGLLVMAGPGATPAAYVGTPLEPLMPVEVDPGQRGSRPRAVDADRYLPVLTSLGRGHTALQLDDDPQVNRERWEGLPEIYWHAPVRKARPGAAVLATHPSLTAAEGEGELLPLMVTQRLGRGQVMYVGFDETWRWRYRRGDQVFYRLWGQLAHYLGAPHLAGEGRASLHTDQAVYEQGQTALVTARLEEPGATPLLVAEDEDGAQTRLSLEPAPGADGLYEARLPLPGAGVHRLWIDGRELEASALIEVEAPRLELREPAANVALMRELAGCGEGEHARLENLDQLLARLDLSPRVVEAVEDVRLWDAPLLAFLIVALLGAEWTLRRLWRQA